MNVISSPCGSKAQTVAKMSISRVLDETNSLAFTGPTISTSCSQGAVEKVTPSLDRLRWPCCGAGQDRVLTHDDPTDRPPKLFAGTNTLHTGGQHQSYLLLPVLPM